MVATIVPVVIHSEKTGPYSKVLRNGSLIIQLQFGVN